MALPKRPYFAHAVNAYDTPLEQSMNDFIASYFGIPWKYDEGLGAGVENPNQPHHQIGYTKYAERQRQADTSHKGMSYFYDEVLPLCDGCVAWPFLDGRMGLGVAGEAKWFLERGLPIYVVETLEARIPTDDELREFERKPTRGPFRIVAVNDVDKALILANDPALVVPHVETRLRTFFVYGKEKRPYEVAHLAQMPLPDNFYPKEK